MILVLDCLISSFYQEAEADLQDNLNQLTRKYNVLVLTCVGSKFYIAIHIYIYYVPM